ncbi:MAG: hypothetical protein ACRD3B_19165, partial [Candidatus Sulfotelmatobacter sp.]
MTFLVVPLGLIVLSRYLPGRLRSPFVLVVSAVTSIFLYCQFRAFIAVGQFLSSDMIWNAVLWGLHDPAVISKYLNLRAFLALLAVVFAVAVLWRWGGKLIRQSPLHRVRARHWYIGIGVVGSCLAALTIVAWAPRLPSTPFHKSVLVWSFGALTNRTDVD